MPDFSLNPEPDRASDPRNYVNEDIIEMDGPADYSIRPTPEYVRKQIEEWYRRQRAPYPRPEPEQK